MTHLASATGTEPKPSATGVCMTLRWREADSNFQFLGLGRAFLYRLGVTAPFLASSRNASGTAFVASNPRPTAPACHVDPRLMTSSCRSALDECAFLCTHGARFAYAPVAGGWLGTEETSLNARVLASCDDVDRRRCLHERCG